MLKGLILAAIYTLGAFALTSPVCAFDLQRAKPGDKFAFWGKLSASGNTPDCSSKHSICIENSAQWKTICEKATTITSQSVISRAVSANSVEAALLKGGTFEIIDISWLTSNTGFEACYVRAQISGTVDGTSQRSAVQGIAREFLVQDSGLISVNKWGFW